MADPGPARPPVYARVLRLRHVHPSGLLCFVFFEGMIALGVLLALAELVSWWAVPLLPATVAGMVKLNDLVAAGSAARAEAPPPADPTSPAAPAGPGIVPPPREPRQVSRDPAELLDPADSPRQRFRQSARRRYR